MPHAEPFSHEAILILAAAISLSWTLSLTDSQVLRKTGFQVLVLAKDPTTSSLSLSLMEVTHIQYYPGDT